MLFFKIAVFFAVLVISGTVAVNPRDHRCTALRGVCGLPSACPRPIKRGLCSGNHNNVCCPPIREVANSFNAVRNTVASHVSTFRNRVLSSNVAGTVSNIFNTVSHAVSVSLDTNIGALSKLAQEFKAEQVQARRTLNIVRFGSATGEIDYTKQSFVTMNLVTSCTDSQPGLLSPGGYNQARKTMGDLQDKARAAVDKADKKGRALVHKFLSFSTQKALLKMTDQKLATYVKKILKGLDDTQTAGQQLMDAVLYLNAVEAQRPLIFAMDHGQRPHTYAAIVSTVFSTNTIPDKISLKMGYADPKLIESMRKAMNMKLSSEDLATQFIAALDTSRLGYDKITEHLGHRLPPKMQNRLPIIGVMGTFTSVAAQIEFYGTIDKSQVFQALTRLFLDAASLAEITVEMGKLANANWAAAAGPHFEKKIGGVVFKAVIVVEFVSSVVDLSMLDAKRDSKMLIGLTSLKVWALSMAVSFSPACVTGGGCAISTTFAAIATIAHVASMFTPTQCEVQRDRLGFTGGDDNLAFDWVRANGCATIASKPYIELSGHINSMMNGKTWTSEENAIADILRCLKSDCTKMQLVIRSTSLAHFFSELQESTLKPILKHCDILQHADDDMARSDVNSASTRNLATMPVHKVAQLLLNMINGVTGAADSAAMEKLMVVQSRERIFEISKMKSTSIDEILSDMNNPYYNRVVTYLKKIDAFPIKCYSILARTLTTGRGECKCSNWALTCANNGECAKNTCQHECHCLFSGANTCTCLRERTAHEKTLPCTHMGV